MVGKKEKIEGNFQGVASRQIVDREMKNSSILGGMTDLFRSHLSHFWSIENDGS